MHTRWLVMVVFCAVCFVGTSHAFAADEDVQVVSAIGVGKDSNEALRNAYRNAVYQVVGAMVRSDQLVTDDQLVRDEILTHSNGFVQRYKLIDRPRWTDSGLVEINILAEVRRIVLTERLQAIKIIEAPINTTEVITKTDANLSAAQMLEKVFDDFPGNIMDVSLQEEPRYDNQTNRILANVRIGVNKEKYNRFIKMLSDILDKTFKAEYISYDRTIEQMSLTNDFDYHISRYQKLTSVLYEVSFFTELEEKSKYLQENNIKNVIIMHICTRLPVFPMGKTESQWKMYILPADDFFGIIRKTSNQNDYQINKYKVIAELIDNEGNVITTVHQEIPRPFVAGYKNDPGYIIVYPILGNIRDRFRITTSNLNGEENMQIPFSISADDRRRMKNIRFSIKRM